MKDVLVVGGIFREVLDGDASPKVRYGGSGLVAAVAAARLGAEVGLASYVGSEDEEAVRLELQTAGVDDSPVVTLPGASGTFVFPTHANDDRPWPMYRPAESAPTTAPESLPDAVVVLVFGIPDYDPISAGWLGKDATGNTVIWDRQGWLSRARDWSGVLGLPYTRRVYVANEEEAIADAGVQTAEQALDFQPPPGFQVAMVKQGVRGVTVVEDTEQGRASRSIQAFQVVGGLTIGTGDVFAGALAARLAKGDAPTEAARWGCAAVAVALRAGASLLDSNTSDAVAHLLSSSTSGNDQR